VNSRPQTHSSFPKTPTRPPIIPVPPCPSPPLPAHICRRVQRKRPHSSSDLPLFAALSLFLYEELQNLPFDFNELRTFCHFCQNNSFVCTLFQNIPGGTPLGCGLYLEPAETDVPQAPIPSDNRFLSARRLCACLPQAGLRATNLLPMLVSSRRFFRLLVSGVRSNGCGLYLEPANEMDRRCSQRNLIPHPYILLAYTPDIYQVRVCKYKPCDPGEAKPHATHF